MKTRTKEENAAHAREQRAKRKGASSVPPIKARTTSAIPPPKITIQERTTVPPTVPPVPPEPVSVPPAVLALIKQIDRRLDAIDDDLRSLKAAIRDITGDNVSPRGATRPGAHPAELYGA